MTTSSQENLAPKEGVSAATAFAVLVFGNILLALGPWLVRIADSGPVATGFWRLTLAIPLLFLIAKRLEPGGISAAKPMWLAIAAGGIFFAADLASWHIGILHTKLANATLFGNVASLIFPIYGFIALRQRPTVMQAAAFGLALFGGTLLMGQSYEASSRYLLGDLLCILAGIFYAAYLVAMLRARERLQSWTVLALSTVAGALPMVIAASAMGETIWPTNWTPLIALALMSQVIGQGALIYALGKLQPLVIGLVLLTQPAISALSGWLAFGETMSAIEGVGAAFIAAALVLVQLKPRALERIETV